MVKLFSSLEIAKVSLETNLSLLTILLFTGIETISLGTRGKHTHQRDVSVVGREDVHTS